MPVHETSHNTSSFSAEPKLNYLDAILPTALRSFENVFSQYCFGAANSFSQPTGKPNYARTTVPVSLRNVDSHRIGHFENRFRVLSILVYAPHNATGAPSESLTLENVIIPGHYVLPNNQESVIPRPRIVDGKPVIVEGYFPLFTLNHQGAPLFGAGCLDELVLPDNPSMLRIIHRMCTVGPGIDRQYFDNPKISYVVGVKSNGDKFGNVHAMHNGTPYYQVAGFLSVTDPNLPLDIITNNWSLPDFDARR